MHISYVTHICSDYATVNLLDNLMSYMLYATFYRWKLRHREAEMLIQGTKLISHFCLINGRNGIYGKFISKKEKQTSH